MKIIAIVILILNILAFLFMEITGVEINNSHIASLIISSTATILIEIRELFLEIKKKIKD
jgi:hypothetical protein